MEELPNISPQSIDQPRMNLFYHQESPLITIPILIIGAIGSGFMLVYFSDILIPFVISLFITYILKPMVDFIHKPFDECCPKLFERKENSIHYTRLGRPHNRNPGFTRCPRIVGVIISLMISFCIIGIFILLISDSITSISPNDIELYKNRAIYVAKKIAGWTKSALNIDVVKIVESFFSTLQLNSIFSVVMYKIYSIIVDTFFIFLIVLYLLFDSRGRPNPIREEINSQIQHYLGVKTIISAVVGVLVYLVLGPLLNIRFANLIGIVTFLMNYIPNVGPIIATFLPSPFIILDPEVKPLNIVLAFLLPSLIHFIVGNFVEPAVFGRSFELHPVVVLLSLAIWYSLWGVSGAILAVPITAVVRIILANTNHRYAKILVNILNGVIWENVE